ncbi:hypothetical protein OUZ56_019988 [Daphnia magna]|uniref:Uncharacterized protein n=1 Tax=Daphnia magna TaxID=35525 RepID=A0ABQ9ZD83_9CRUS|nr:hypothetical protein OUZ56_019988 [Daphnia magna]
MYTCCNRPLSAAFPLYSSRSQAVQSTEDHFAEMLACCDFRPRIDGLNNVRLPKKTNTGTLLYDFEPQDVDLFYIRLWVERTDMLMTEINWIS